MVDPEFELKRQIAAITSKRKKTDEDLAMIARLEWYGGLYEENGAVVQPTSKIRKCLINTAKINKSGKMVERALSFETLNVPLIYDGPKNIDDLFKAERYHSRMSVGIGTKRVMKVRPKFFPWALKLSGLFVEDAGLNYEDFERIVELSGIVEGIGDGRSIGYGRFVGKVVTL
jgi:hypothetical protein